MAHKRLVEGRLLALSNACDLRPAIAKVMRDARDLNALARIAAPLLRAIDALIEGQAAPDPADALRSLDAGELGLSHRRARRILSGHFTDLLVELGGRQRCGPSGALSLQQPHHMLD